MAADYTFCDPLAQSDAAPRVSTLADTRRRLKRPRL
jgi:hypothetical protein